MIGRFLSRTITKQKSQTKRTSGIQAVGGLQFCQKIGDKGQKVKRFSLTYFLLVYITQLVTKLSQKNFYSIQRRLYINIHKKLYKNSLILKIIGGRSFKASKRQKRQKPNDLHQRRRYCSGIAHFSPQLHVAIVRLLRSFIVGLFPAGLKNRDFFSVYIIEEKNFIPFFEKGYR